MTYETPDKLQPRRNWDAREGREVFYEITDPDVQRAYIKAEVKREMGEKFYGETVGEKSFDRFADLLVQHDGDVAASVHAYSAPLSSQPEPARPEPAATAAWDPFVSGALDQVPGELVVASTADEDRLLDRIERGDVGGWRQKALLREEWARVHEEGNARRQADAERREFEADPVRVKAAALERATQKLGQGWHNHQKDARLRLAAASGALVQDGDKLVLGNTNGLSERQAAQLEQEAAGLRRATRGDGAAGYGLLGGRWVADQ